MTVIHRRPALDPNQPHPYFRRRVLNLNRGILPGPVQFKPESNLSRADVVNARNVRDRMNPSRYVPDFVANFERAKALNCAVTMLLPLFLFFLLFQCFPNLL